MRKILLLMVVSALVCETVIVTHAGERRRQPELPARRSLFQENIGQVDSSVKFFAPADSNYLMLTANGAVVAGAGNDPLHMEFINGNAAAMAGEELAMSRTNYLLGSSQYTDVRNYAAVRYRQLYPHIDLLFYGHEDSFEYDFIVTPGGDVNDIQLKFNGARAVTIDAGGDLQISMSNGSYRQLKPVVYQQRDAQREYIPARYRLRGDLLGFQIGAYDHSRPLIIDPIIGFSTLLGTANSTGFDDNFSCQDLALDSEGNIYLLGQISSSAFPAVNAFQNKNFGSQDLMVVKLNARGDTVLFATYLGGRRDDAPGGIAVDKSGNVYITGWTYSDDYPVTNALQSERKKSYTPQEAFVTKLSRSGNALIYSTYLSGKGTYVGTMGNDIAVGSDGSCYVTGVTDAADFPVVNAIQPALAMNNGGITPDAFVTKISPAGDALVFSTFLGGRVSDVATSIVIDKDGGIAIAGNTDSPDFPLTAPYQATIKLGEQNSFLARLQPDGSGLVFSTYFGGSAHEMADALAVDSEGNLYLTGTTTSADLPLVRASQVVLRGGVDIFASKFTPDGKELIYSTYLGGTAGEGFSSAAVDSTGNLFITGRTHSVNFPLLRPLQAKFGSKKVKNTIIYDAFISKLTPLGAVDYSTYLGGKKADVATDIAVDKNDNVIIIGGTASGNFPATTRLHQSALTAFIVKVTDIVITRAQFEGKKLRVYGKNIANGELFIDGRAVPATTVQAQGETYLVARGLNKKIAAGQTVMLEVRNADGMISAPFSYTR